MVNHGSVCAPACGAAMYFRRKTSAGRAYLQIVESRRDGDQVRQQVIATLGAVRGTEARTSSSHETRCFVGDVHGLL